MRYRIKLYGFSEAETRAMRFSLEYPAAGEVGFEIVEAAADTDFAIVDADSAAAVQDVGLDGQTARGVFVGATPPAEAPIVVPRPLDVARMRRSLARLMARHGAESRDTGAAASHDDPDEIIVFEPQMVANIGPLPTRPEELPPMPMPEPAPAPSPVPVPAAGPRAASPTLGVASMIVMPEPIPAPPPAPKPPQASPRPIGRVEFPPPAGGHEVINLSEIPIIGSEPRIEDDRGAQAPGPPPEAPSEYVLRERKAAARAAARRARITHNQTDPGQLENLRDVMVLDPDAQAAEQLRELLELFGFRVHVAHHIAEAADVLSRHALVAAFVDVPVNGKDQGDGLALLQTIQDLPKLIGHPTPAVLLVSGPLRPSDQVRARLAGVNMHIQKPISRGPVARALEGCQIVLPADERRSI
jgi:CheY-like chemotaxis protein